MSGEAEVKRWAGNLLRDATLRAAGDAAFWGTDTGKGLLVQLDRFVSPHVARQVRSSLRYAVESTEVTNTIVVQMSIQPSFVSGLRRSLNPWGYLAECARRWSSAQAGHRVLELDGLTGVEPASEGVEELFDPASGLTAVAEVVGLTTAILRGYTKGVDGGALNFAVTWFAHNPPQHQGHGHTEARNAPELAAVGLSPGEVGALANVTWGGRPNMRSTSLFYGYLLDPNFEPEGSRTHRVALTTVRRAFARRQTNGGK